MGEGEFIELSGARKSVSSKLRWLNRVLENRLTSPSPVSFFKEETLKKSQSLIDPESESSPLLAYNFHLNLAL